MLVCPQCQFENPNTNKFCQKCGTSLTHKTCDTCDSQVPFSEEYCPNCGAFAGTVWWAVISKESDWQPQVASLTLQEVSIVTNSEPLSSTSDLEPSEARGTQNPASVNVTTLGSAVDESSIEASTVNLSVADSLSVTEAATTDTTTQTPPTLQSVSVSSEGVEPLSVETGPSSDLANNEQQLSEGTLGDANRQEDGDQAILVQASVPSAGAQFNVYIDPGQRYRLLETLPPLAAGQVQVRVLDTQPFQKSPLEALTTWNAQLNQQPTISNQQSEAAAIGIPALAQPYLALQGQFYPTLPRIHDAWHQEGTSVILLEDRSQWQLLGEVWGNRNLPILQILYWLDELVKLWSALEPWKCRQSLLDVTNLRVDEDQTLSLQQLYAEPQDANLTVQDLGKMWQTLSQKSQRTQFTSLDQLFRDLRLGEIVTIEQLRSRLEAMAHELQAEAEIPEATPPIPVVTQNQMSESSSPFDQAQGTPFTPESFIGDSSESDDMPTVILPMQVLSLEDAGCTDIGRLRDHNEDYFGIQTQITKEENPRGRKVQARGLYILCDGMGGHAGGEVASIMAVENIRSYFQANWDNELPDEKTIREAVLLGNQAIYDVNQQNSRSGSGRMGTTLVIVLIQETKVAVAHVGDSRLYRLSRKRGLEQVTMDHEVGQREIQRGVERAIAYSRPDAYQLTQALGPRDENFVNPDIQFMELNEDTLLLLCSDGLSDHDLLETHWQTHLLPLISSRANLEQGVLQLIDLANQHNGHDNITAVLIRARVRPNLDQQ